MDACTISPGDFLNAHYVITSKTAVTVFFKENFTENMRSRLEFCIENIQKKSSKNFAVSADFITFVTRTR